MSMETPGRRPAPQALVQPDSRRNVIAGLILLALVFLGSGLLHFTYGGNIGCHVLVKEEWSLHDTFVNMEEIENMSFLEALASGHRGIVRALIRDGYIENPSSTSPHTSGPHFRTKGRFEVSPAALPDQGSFRFAAA